MTIKQQRILAIEAHPDDLVFFYGASIAKMITEGHQIRVITVTSGDQSTVDPALTTGEIEAILKEEHATAMKIIGVTDQKYLEGFTNHFMFSSEIQLKLREVLIREIREFKPDTVITFDIADVFEENPDHQLLARVGMQAASFAAYPLIHAEQLQDGLNPHFVARLLLAPTRQPNAFIDIDGEPLDKQNEAAKAYKSQLALMVTELEQRSKTIGLVLPMNNATPEELWDNYADITAVETAKIANAYYAQHKAIAPHTRLLKAEAFRMQYLGAVEKARDLLPREFLIL
ncbi:MAG TPA: PIG-L deacetylase family protein [Candidatus Lokiarchaeia archaeon]|nr:PIG-L deacetylase family protein [Candidatus Lokiarchaeia archaeon]